MQEGRARPGYYLHSFWHAEPSLILSQVAASTQLTQESDLPENNILLSHPRDLPRVRAS